MRAFLLVVCGLLVTTAHSEAPHEQCEATGTQDCSEKASSLVQRQAARELTSSDVLLSEDDASEDAAQQHTPLIDFLTNFDAPPSPVPVTPPPIMVPDGSSGASLAEVEGGDCGTHNLLYEGIQVLAPNWLWTWYYYDSSTHTAQKCGDDCARVGCKSFLYEEYIAPSSAAGTAWCYMFFDDKSTCQTACHDTSVNHVCDFKGNTVRGKTPSNACGDGHHGGSYGFKDSEDLCKHPGPNGVCGNGVVWDPATWKWPRSQFIGHGQKFSSCTPNGSGGGTAPAPAAPAPAPAAAECVRLTGFNTGYVLDGVYKQDGEKNGKPVWKLEGSSSWVIWWNPHHVSHIYGYNYLQQYAAWEVNPGTSPSQWVYSFGNPGGDETTKANNVLTGDGSESIPVHGRGNNYWHVTATGTMERVACGAL